MPSTGMRACVLALSLYVQSLFADALSTSGSGSGSAVEVGAGGGTVRRSQPLRRGGGKRGSSSLIALEEVSEDPLEVQADGNVAAAEGLRGVIRNKHGRCLSVSDDGAEVLMATCADSTPLQQWMYNAASGQLKHEGLCLDTADRHSDGGKVFLGPCEEELLSQMWAYDVDAQQIHSQDGICLDGADKDSGAVRMKTCASGGKGQAWSLLMKLAPPEGPVTTSTTTEVIPTTTTVTTSTTDSPTTTTTIETTSTTGTTSTTTTTTSTTSTSTTSTTTTTPTSTSTTTTTTTTAPPLTTWMYVTTTTTTIPGTGGGSSASSGTGTGSYQNKSGGVPGQGGWHGNSSEWWKQAHNNSNWQFWHHGMDHHKKKSTSLIPVGACVDSVYTGIRFRGGKQATCTDLVNYCKHPRLGQKVRESCVKTCGRCSLATMDAAFIRCIDKPMDVVPVITIGGLPQNCTQLKKFCNGHPDSEYVLRKCPRSCLFCSPPTTTTTTQTWTFSTSAEETDTGAGLGCSRRRRWGFCYTRRRRMEA